MIITMVTKTFRATERTAHGTPKLTVMPKKKLSPGRALCTSVIKPIAGKIAVSRLKSPTI
jgi:hypothetical protein